jgi:two-component system, chemotaxis family, chemotaxis protein CheY
MMSLTVLAVDDSKTMRDLLRAALVPQGFEVCLAGDGQEGLDMLGSVNPHVIITDINMPRLDGFGFIEGVRGRSDMRGTPILVLTTESAPELKQRARDAGATGWIVKPFDRDKLIAAVRRVAG